MLRASGYLILFTWYSSLAHSSALLLRPAPVLAEDEARDEVQSDSENTSAWMFPLEMEETLANEALLRSEEECRKRDSPYTPACLKFIHIPKHAGSTFEDWAYQRGYSWGKNFLHAGGYYPDLDLYNHAPVVAYAPWHAPPAWFKRDPYQNFHTFTVVRNPYEHMISEFRCRYFGYYAQTPPGFPLIVETGTPGTWLKALVLTEPQRKRARASATKGHLNRWIRSMLLKAPGWWWGHISYHRYVIKPDGTWRMPPENVLRFENLEEDFAALVKRYNLKPGPLVSVNSVDDMPRYTIDDLERNTISLIEKAFAEDFRLFNYTKVSNGH